MCLDEVPDVEDDKGVSQSQASSTVTHKPPSANQDTGVMAAVAQPTNSDQPLDVTNSSHREMENEGLNEGNTERKSDIRMGVVRPKSGKVLVRKNTPAMLPKVEKLHCKSTYESRGDFLVNTKHLYNICTMSDQHWADVVDMLYKCFVFAGLEGFKLSFFSNLWCFFFTRWLDFRLPSPLSNFNPPFSIKRCLSHWQVGIGQSHIPMHEQLIK